MKMATVFSHKLDWQLSKISIKERFSELLSLSQWTDCSFAVGRDREVIKCHKIVLAVSSPVFEALFFGGLASKEELVYLPDVDPFVFKLLLRYIYSDKLELVSVEDAGGLLYVAKKYLMPHLRKLCLDYLIEKVCITTLWDILSLSETLDEEELFAPCIKVMCQYPPHIWMEEGRRLSGRIVSLLAMEDGMNLNELELWSFIIDWAKSELKYKEKEEEEEGKPLPSPVSLRLLLQDILPSIRFMKLTQEDLLKEVVPTGILNKFELENICGAVRDSDPFLLPTGFSMSTEERTMIAQTTWVCSREKLVRGMKFWIYGTEEGRSGIVCGSRIKSKCRILLTGFKVFSRILPGRMDDAEGIILGGRVGEGGWREESVVTIEENRNDGLHSFLRPRSSQLGHEHHRHHDHRHRPYQVTTPSDPHHFVSSWEAYNEQFSVLIKDSEGNVVAEVEYKNVANFDSIQVVKLSTPMWIESSTTYTVLFSLHCGCYPLYSFADTSVTKGTTFTFDDFCFDSKCNVNHFLQTNNFKCSFIHSILYTF